LLAQTVAALNAEGGGALYESVLGLKGKGKKKDDNADIAGIKLYVAMRIACA